MKFTAEALRGKKIGFFGLGKSNLDLLQTLPLERCEIILRSEGKIDRGTLPRKLLLPRILDGERAFLDIREDVLFLSPSMRRDRRELSDAVARGVVFSSDAELFFENARAPIYAVTGSDGKSTTATLAEKLLLKSRNALLVGNIGQPMFSSLSRNADCYVAELSSFMLSYITPKVRRAAITNITPNHLDWHSSFEEYKSVKLGIFREAEEKILCFDDEILSDYARENDVFAISSTRLSFHELVRTAKAHIYLTVEGEHILLNGERLLPLGEIGRSEEHNLRNLMTAIALTYGEVDVGEIREVAKEFPGLPHRCDLVLQRDGIDFYDSSIDSTPSRTVKTLTALGRRCVIILGGRGKGCGFSELCPALAKYAEYAVICGECADEIYRDVKGSCRTVMVDDFDCAVDFATELGRLCGCVLLSPAATSYDAFSNYEKRGERFKFLVKNIDTK